MKTTRYFEEQVLRKRPYIDPAWYADVISRAARPRVQLDGRVRFWGEIRRPEDDAPRILRVVKLADGKTVQNAFFDRGFRKEDE